MHRVKYNQEGKERKERKKRDGRRCGVKGNLWFFASFFEEIEEDTDRVMSRRKCKGKG